MGRSPRPAAVKSRPMGAPLPSSRAAWRNASSSFANLGITQTSASSASELAENPPAGRRAPLPGRPRSCAGSRVRGGKRSLRRALGSCSPAHGVEPQNAARPRWDGHPRQANRGPKPSTAELFSSGLMPGLFKPMPALVASRLFWGNRLFARSAKYSKARPR